MGPSPRLQAARALVALSLAADVLPRSLGRRRRRSFAKASGTLAIAGTLLLRFGIVAAGKASARDPHASFEMQRRGRGAAEIAKKEQAASMPSLPGVDATGKEFPHAGPGV